MPTTPSLTRQLNQLHRLTLELATTAHERGLAVNRAQTATWAEDLEAATAANLAAGTALAAAFDTLADALFDLEAAHATAQDQLRLGRV